MEDASRLNALRFVSALALLLMVLSSSTAIAKPKPPGGNPPGNNGTIKVDNEEFDESPGNEPKINDCQFQIDFYGFDEGDLEATIMFELFGSTPGPSYVPPQSPVFIGEDPAGGGTDVDAQVTIDLSEFLANSGTEPKNGFYQIKLTVHAEGSQGADTKFKVFKVLAECVPPAGSDPGAILGTEELGGDATATSLDAEQAPSRDGLGVTGGELLAAAALAGAVAGASVLTNRVRRRTRIE